jgi:hypothetical protein
VEGVEGLLRQVGAAGRGRFTPVAILSPYRGLVKVEADPLLMPMPVVKVRGMGVLMGQRLVAVEMRVADVCG